MPKLDTHAKTTGQAEYTMDVYREGMETVVVAHPDKMGAVVASFDDTDALKVPGVIAVREIPQGGRGLCQDHRCRAQGARGIAGEMGRQQSRNPVERADLCGFLDVPLPKAVAPRKRLAMPWRGSTGPRK